MAHSYFITATDTGLGKTYVTRALADTISVKMPVTYCKPVQTGCERRGGVLIAPDAEYVFAGAAQQFGDDNVHTPYRFEPPVSPHLAARLAGESIDMARIRACVLRLRERCAGVVLVEGAGGILAPISDSLAMADVAKALDIPVIVVTSARLGTLNHTALTLEALSRRGLRLAGVVINEAGARELDIICTDNSAAITRMAGPAPVALLGHNSTGGESIQAFCDELIRN
jgi:dethiobiotin synthetase